MSNAKDALLALAEQNIAELQAENAKLRKKINALKAHGIEIADAVAGGYEIYDIQQREVDRLEVENDKLRKLASILCFCMQIHKQCDDCKLNGAKGEIAHDPLLACDGLHEMLRELGIEVPELLQRKSSTLASTRSKMRSTGPTEPITTR